MKLETARLILRKPEARDVDDYMEFRNSNFVLRYNAMTPKNREETLTQFTKEVDEWNTFVLEHKELGKVIGVVFTEEDSLRWGVASKELSYFMNEVYSRQGYMKEALFAVISYLFSEEALDCVAARSFAPNVASRKLLESLGFHQDGLIPRCVKGFRDVVFDDTLYSVFRNEFACNSAKNGLTLSL